MLKPASQNEHILSDDQNKTIALFQFVRELNKLKQSAVLNYSDHPWAIALSTLPNDPDNITISYRDRVDSENQVIDDTILLSVHKPEFTDCPAPNPILSDWLASDWNDFRKQAHYIQSRKKEDSSSKEKTPDIEYFTDNTDRVVAYNAWLQKRTAWAERQTIIQQTKTLFSDLYRLYFDFQRDSETMELIIANGILLDKNNPRIKHPLLTKRVKLNYDSHANTIYIEETDSPSELYAIIFQSMNDINLDTINHMQTDLQNNDYHPLDRNDTPIFLKTLIHQLSSSSIFSTVGVPDNWSSSNDLLLYTEPIYIMRKRLDGTVKFIDRLIETVQETGSIPGPIVDIVGGGTDEPPAEPTEISLEEQLAAVGGESIDVLLSKEANKEQLEIAKRIENHNAVLVQGPPGTGKTHTIANLMGHFLAQGKTVLVTSHTPKALHVLKDKVAPGLQSLCVSVLEDSNIDMERSIDGITNIISQTTPYELKQDMERLSQERQHIITSLADVRRKIFRILNQERECIVYNGESLSPSAAASFVCNNAETLSYIPGKVRLDTPLTVSFEELADLYRSNEHITADDEYELHKDVPNPTELLSPEAFSHIQSLRQKTTHELNTLKANAPWSFSYNTYNHIITFTKDDRSFSIAAPSVDTVLALQDSLRTLTQFEPWMKAVAIDGKNGGAFRKRWQTLIDQILTTCTKAESVIDERFGHDVNIEAGGDTTTLTNAIEALRPHLEQRGLFSKIKLNLVRSRFPVLKTLSIDGHPLQTASDCDLILHILDLNKHRAQCALYWNELLSPHDVPNFFDLDRQYPERIAKNWIADIQTYLDWYQTIYSPLSAQLNTLGISENILYDIKPSDSDLTVTEKKLTTTANELPVICDICKNIINLTQLEHSLAEQVTILQKSTRKESHTCLQVVNAIHSGNTTEYANSYVELLRMYQKYDAQRQRQSTLSKIAEIAPQWASAIKNREGIHGSKTVPSTIEDAWKWKQLAGLIEQLTQLPFNKLQDESIALSKEYRNITAQYAEKSAWYHLACKTKGNNDIQQALHGWKLTIKKIGKGTGKNAPKLKAIARDLMSVCQSAVPCWIMPMNRVLETLIPGKNLFDIIIIDEASQSDISSLAILYMGKKLIIVGDDKQVSPMAVGVDVDKINALQQMYIQDKIPNAHLYDAKTSIYDIAKTTFHPLMLREHFRCVPEIIGFSNMLSYDYKIKPLRSSGSSNLLPAVISYRVANGKRDHRKTNLAEAKTIVALMQACINQPEYKNKTFGVISLLGDEQVHLIQHLLEEQLDAKELTERNILCGNASHFQGDERDVIFLSTVDSGDENGPIRLQGFGSDDAFRKRYNVAASRAKDQLWVVHSLDTVTDLKSGDIRKILIDYAVDPNVLSLRHAEIEEKADSPFEIAVARALVDRGYHLAQQWQVGAYRLDIVAIYGKQMVAIECDGERYHSGETKIREDMERQTILERLGWRFIRIRGSEYFRDPEQAINRVINKLNDYGIMPEANTLSHNNLEPASELLNRVKAEAANILLHVQDNTIPLSATDTLTAKPSTVNTIPNNIHIPIISSAAKTAATIQSQSVTKETTAVTQPQPATKKVISQTL